MAQFQEQIASLTKLLDEATLEIKQRDNTVDQKDQTIELLQGKLKETSHTLVSNNSTIDSLKQSLAEAQKYSFRAILNNRQGVHHPGSNT